MRTIEEQYELLEGLLAIAKRGGENGELDWLEFKTNIAEQSASITYEGVGKYISGMANIACVKYKDYAYLVLGIENATWNPVGTNLRMQDQKINNQDYQLWLRKLVEPHIRFEFEEFDYKGKHIVIFEIPAAVGEPVTFKGEAYIRINSNLTKLKDFTDYTRQIYSSQQDWSAQIVKDATLDDLDPRAIARARELYIDKHQHLASDVASWDDKTFLNKAKITRNGRITNTAIILLGKEESEVLISPAVSKIRWILKGTDGVERDYRILSCPMVLAIDEVFHLVRNLKYRYINPNLRTLFPEEIDTYEPYVIREALNNAVAHQAIVHARRERHVSRQQERPVERGELHIAHEHGIVDAVGSKIRFDEDAVPVLATVAVLFQCGNTFCCCSRWRSNHIFKNCRLFSCL